MEILLEVDEAHRGKVIDDLDDKAFENLLDRIPDDQRLRFAKLVTASKRADRKLLLWAEVHKARAGADLARHQGDIGREPPKHKGVDEDGGVVWDIDADEKSDIDATYTRSQRINRRRHERRTAAVESTNTEVDAEVKRLMTKAKKGDLTLEDVDDMRDRKELEYQIELENNVNLTASGTRASGDAVQWDKDELESMKITLSRLPQVQDPEAVATINRSQTVDILDGKGGEYQGDTIQLYDWGAGTSPGFRRPCRRAPS